MSLQSVCKKPHQTTSTHALENLILLMVYYYYGLFYISVIKYHSEKIPFRIPFSHKRAMGTGIHNSGYSANFKMMKV